METDWTPAPDLSILKTETSSGPYTKDDEITYSIVVTNTGNVTLHDVDVTDANATLGTCTPTVPVADLAPGDTITCAASHTVTQGEIESGSFTNTAYVTDDDVCPAAATAPADQCKSEVPTDWTPAPNLSTLKTETSTGPYAKDDTITYSIVVTNTGNVTLHNVDLLDFNATLGTCTPTLPVANLAPGENITCDASHTLTQDDMAGGVYNNAARATDDDACPADAPNPAEACQSYVETPLELGGTLIINKVTLPAGGTGFDFTTTGGLDTGEQDPTKFSLDDGGQKTFSDVVPGSYTVTEDDPSGLGYVLTDVTCAAIAAPSGAPAAPVSSTVNIELSAGETITCTFTNTLLGNSGIEKAITASNQDFTSKPDETDPPFSSLEDVAIGEIITYKVTVNLAYGDYFNTNLVDTMGQGLALVGCDKITVSNITPTDFSSACANPIFLPQPTPPLPDSVDYKRIVEFDLGGPLHVGPGGGSITLAYRAVVLDSAGNRGVPPPPYPTQLSNSAVFHYTDTDATTPVRDIGTGSVTVEVVEPQLMIEKEADTEFIGLGTIVTFTLTIEHTPNSHTPAFDVLLTDPIKSQFDLVSPIDCTLSTNDPTAPLPLDNAGVITAGWSEFDIGDVGICTFKLQVNDTLSVGEDVSNVAYVEWTSLPGVPGAVTDCDPITAGDQPGDPGEQNCGDFSTERFYDPNDPAGVNTYFASSDVRFTAPGGGEKEGRGKKFQLPGTGFAPGVVTALSGKPAVAYNDNLGVNLRIPKLKLDMAVEGVPYANDVWQVDWLTGVGGWLQGTAFPGLSGNSVIMSHVVTHYGSPGPFARLNALNVGDNIYVTSLGRTYVYQVRKTGTVAADDISVLKHATKPVLTLITCSQWNEATQTYDGRFVVYAELIQ